MSLYPHIKKVQYLRIEIDKKTFNKIFSGRVVEYKLERTPYYESQVLLPNEFVRFINGEYYMDCKIRRIDPKVLFIVHIGQIIDYNHKRSPNN